MAETAKSSQKTFKSSERPKKGFVVKSLITSHLLESVVFIMSTVCVRLRHLRHCIQNNFKSLFIGRMVAQLISGTEISKQLLNEVAEKIKQKKENNSSFHVVLAIVQVDYSCLISLTIF